MLSVSLQAEDGMLDSGVTGVQLYALQIEAEDGIRDIGVTGVQTCALLFQAEDGIRDIGVTGVQTCALPISNIEPQTFIQGGSVPYPPVPTRNDGRTAPPRTH